MKHLATLSLALALSACTGTPGPSATKRLPADCDTTRVEHGGATRVYCIDRADPFIDWHPQ